MTTISIIVPTNRIGGLDVLFDGLAHQSFKDFELILIDNILQYRADLLIEQEKKLPFKFKYSKAYGNIQFPYANYTGSINTGIHLAESKYILILADYMFLSEFELENRVKMHEDLNDYKAVIHGNYITHKMPKLHAHLQGRIYAPSERCLPQFFQAEEKI